MDLTSELNGPPQDSESPSVSFNSSLNLSTPISHNLSRKRKREEPESYPPSPQLSSTLNESVLVNFKDITLNNSKNQSLPNIESTPEKQIRVNRFLLKNITASPIEESRKILYGDHLKTVKSERKFSPYTFSVGRRCNRWTSETVKLFNKVMMNEVIMDRVFKYLSNGDLYRFGKVSNLFYEVIYKNPEARTRHEIFKENFKDNKENYIITPPSSPEKSDSPPRTENEYYNKFVQTAKLLNRSQSLNKCRKCTGPAVIENDLSQCQSLSCGLIYCLRCSSYSETGPENFKDSCGNSILRPKLRNVSNCMEESFYSNVFNFSGQDSGFYSENDSPREVCRKLFSTSHTDIPKALSISHHNVIPCREKKKMQKSLAFTQVIPSNNKKKEVIECDSPPRVCYAVGSKQSKRNLKRLTR